MFKVNNRNTTKGCEICSKSTIKAPDRRQGSLCSCFFGILNIFYTFFYCFYCWLWASNVTWENPNFYLQNYFKVISYDTKQSQNNVTLVITEGFLIVYNSRTKKLINKRFAFFTVIYDYTYTRNLEKISLALLKKYNP